MVGGKIHEIIAVAGRLWVNVVDAPYGKPEYCALYVEENETSLKMAPGDSFWWQSNMAYWTPAAHSADNNVPHSVLQGGVDYDIAIPRIGYSGASRPGTRIVTEIGKTIGSII